MMQNDNLATADEIEFKLAANKFYENDTDLNESNRDKYQQSDVQSRNSRQYNEGSNNEYRFGYKWNEANQSIYFRCKKKELSPEPEQDRNNFKRMSS